MNSRFHVPISVKLVFVSTALMLIAVALIATRNSELFESTFGKSQYDANAELANSKAIEVEGQVFTYLEKIRTVSNLLLQEFSDESQRRSALDLVFANDLDLVNVDVYQLKEGYPTLHRRETNEAYLRQFDQTKAYIERLRQEKQFPVMSVFADREKIVILNSTLENGAPLFSLGVPFADANGIVRHVAVADIRLDRLQKAFSLSGARTLYLVDRSGTVLAHMDDKHAVEGRSFAGVPIVQDALAAGGVAMKGQKRFKEPGSDHWYVGAYSKTPFGLTVIAQAPEAIILEPARLVRLESFEVAGYVLSAGLFFVILFSITLTGPIEKLHEATLHVAQGNFDIKAKIRSHDEVGELAAAFNQMVDGLKERDKVKSLFNKFHGSSVTEDLLKRSSSLGGSKKDVTVFFSDIRGFTKFSEGHTPEEVVEMLNEYFQIMVTIITNNHGIVDKFVGDAIMAVWGAPASSGNDCFNAVRASLEMRIALAKLNQKRKNRGQSSIRIGMGLHCGPAISGTIGSTERMEYTVIGDTVNMASRIEASTKAFGSDLLISDSVVARVGNGFILELAGEAEVKGKAEPIKMYKVKGFIGQNGKPVPVETPYSDYTPEGADKVKIAG